MPRIDQSSDLDLTEVCNLINDQGFFAYVEQTGGGCATIYAYRSATMPDGSAAPMPDLMAGPGAFDWNGSNHVGYRSEFNWGSASADPALVRNGDAGNDEYSADLNATRYPRRMHETQIAGRIVAVLRKARARWGDRADMVKVAHRFVPLREVYDYCDLCGYRVENPIHRRGGRVSAAARNKPVTARPNLAHASLLAGTFAGVLRGWLNDDEWACMRVRNFNSQDRHVCASHDYCDANEAMDAAWVMLFDRHAESASTSDTELWNHAWDVAKERYLTGWETHSCTYCKVAV